MKTRSHVSSRQVARLAERMFRMGPEQRENYLNKAGSGSAPAIPLDTVGRLVGHIFIHKGDEQDPQRRDVLRRRGAENWHCSSVTNAAMWKGCTRARPSRPLASHHRQSRARRSGPLPGHPAY
jgi:hypothetical protein